MSCEGKILCKKCSIFTKIGLIRILVSTTKVLRIDQFISTKIDKMTLRVFFSLIHSSINMKKRVRLYVRNTDIQNCVYVKSL